MTDSSGQAPKDSQQTNAQAKVQEQQEGASTSSDTATSDGTKTSARRFRNARLLALATGVGNLGVLIVGSFIPDLLYWSLCGTGIISFIGILTLVNYTSQDPNFQKGEMRKAIAGSFFIFYFVIMGVFVSSGFGAPSNSQLQAVIEQLMAPLSYLAGAIGAYYFGSRSFEKFLGQRNDGK